MELKQHTETEHRIRDELLIVPYGIETYLPDASACFFLLLIVPYGIETIL